MRNLKRALSLALATVMTLGLMVVGTGAVGYDDVTSEDNVEAIEVLQAVGIMTGVSEDEFNPDGLVTRNQMAVIMSQLLNLDYDYYRGTNPFTDVPSWAAPYVAACAAEGVTAGIGGGLYGGENNVTAAQAALMILKALGYFQYEGDFGGDWQVATVRQASQIGLFSSVNSNADAALTRGQVAQMVLNGLKADMVYFTGTVGTELTLPDGTKYTAGYVSEYSSRTSSDKKYDTLVGGKTDIAQQGQYYIQLGEELYDGDLTEKTSTDVYGRPATTWTYDRDEIGTYADEADVTYTVATEVSDIYSDLGLDATVDTKDINYYEDGEPSDAQYDITRRGDDKYGAQGATTEVYYDDDTETVTISVINTFLGIVTDDDYTQDSEDGILITVYGAAADTFFLEGSSYDQDTVLLVQVADDEIQTVIGEPNTVEGSLTRIGVNKTTGDVENVTIDGTKYPVAAQYDANTDDDVIDGEALDNLKVDEDVTYVLYLDQYDNFIAAAVLDDSSVSDLVYVYDKDIGTVLDGNRVKYGVIVNVVRLDGTVEELVIGETHTTESNSYLNGISSLIKAGEFGELSYDEDDDKYSLTTLNNTADPDNVNNTISGDYGTADVSANTEFEVDDARITLGGKTHYLNDSTVYLFIDENSDGDAIDSVEVVVGGIDYKSVAGKAAIGDSREVTAMAFEDTYNATSDNILYFKADTKAGSTIAKDVYGYEGYQVGSNEKVEYAISDVNGVTFTKSTKLGGFYEYTENSKGYLELTKINYNTFADDEDSYLNNAVLNEIKNGILTWNSDADSALVSNAVVVDLTDKDKAAQNTYGKNVTSVTTLDRILDNGYTVTVDLFSNKDNEVEAIFITNISGNPKPVDDDEIESEVAVDDRYSAIYTEAGITTSIKGNDISISVDRATLKEFIANEANAGDLALMEGTTQPGKLWVGVAFEAPEGATQATFSGDVTGTDNVDSTGMIYLWLSVADKTGSNWTVQSADKSYEITLTWANASSETIGTEEYTISIDF